jgi:hypothetical protein
MTTYSRRVTMRAALAGLLLPALLAACHNAPAGNAATPAPEATGPDPFETKIVALPEPLRRTTFFRAIRDAGFDCQQVVKEAARPRYRDHPMWAAECDDGGQYLLTLIPGGVFQVSGPPNANPNN